MDELIIAKIQGLIANFEELQKELDATHLVDKYGIVESKLKKLSKTCDELNTAMLELSATVAKVQERELILREVEVKLSDLTEEYGKIENELKSYKDYIDTIERPVNELRSILNSFGPVCEKKHKRINTSLIIIGAILLVILIQNPSVLNMSLSIAGKLIKIFFGG